ncbi:MAG: hypothetical protein CVT92_14650 [Bacteroidetes bacterium HGW-Bacteroidetes-1]|nr:MAG: hypothetical protein CVT92_14650 [Bacteroidetes bacterium HGW-Bacteroidetes-1]
MKLIAEAGNVCIGKDFIVTLKTDGFLGLRNIRLELQFEAHLMRFIALESLHSLLTHLAANLSKNKKN